MRLVFYLYLIGIVIICLSIIVRPSTYKLVSAKPIEFLIVAFAWPFVLIILLFTPKEHNENQ